MSAKLPHDTTQDDAKSGKYLGRRGERGVAVSVKEIRFPSVQLLSLPHSDFAFLPSDPLPDRQPLSHPTSPLPHLKFGQEECFFFWVESGKGSFSLSVPARYDRKSKGTDFRTSMSPASNCFLCPAHRRLSGRPNGYSLSCNPFCEAE